MVSYKRARNIFAVLLLLSLIWQLYDGSPGRPLWGISSPEDAGTLEILVMWATVAMPVISAAGLIVTTFFAWRKDRRDQDKHEAEMARLEESSS